MTKNKDEEIALDFSKITRFFTKKTNSEKKEEQTTDKKDDEINVDMNSIKKFFSKYGIILLILIPILLSTAYRVQPAYLPITDSWAEQSLYNSLRGEIRSQVDQQNPHLSSANKNELVERELKNVLSAQGPQIEQQIQSTSQYFKTQLQDENGQTYLLAIDPWTWYDEARNIDRYGHPGTEIRDGKYWNGKYLAPLGRQAHKDFHIYFIYYWYKFLNFFNSKITLLTAQFYVPVLLVGLATIPAFFIGRRFAGNFGGLTTATFLAISGPLISRTGAGFSDTDAYNAFFPMLILWLLIESFYAKDTKKQLLFGGLTGLASAFYGWAWIGWWFVYLAVLGGIGAYLVFLVVTSKSKNPIKVLKTKHAKGIIGATIAMVIAVTIFGAWFTGLENVTSNALYKAPMSMIRFKDVGTTTIWPNVFTTVAEQNTSSYGAVINQIGGKLIFTLGAVGILLLFIRKENNKLDLRAAFVLLLLFVGTLYAAKTGIRYIILFVPAFSIGLGIAFGWIANRASEFASAHLDTNKKIAHVIMMVMLVLLLFFPRNIFAEGQNVARNEIPSMNDGWYNALTKINNEAAPDAVINSWWDFGHWFKAIGDRRVTFDGATQNTPMAHWIGKALLTDDENQARGILRMLDCGSRTGFETLEASIGDSLVALDYVYTIIEMHGPEEARAYLQEKNVPTETINAVLPLTHCDAPENYFIASEDMIGKSGVWAHFGAWDFTRATIVNKVKTLPREQAITEIQALGFTEDEASNYYYETISLTSSQVNNWIAPWPSYAGTPSVCTQEEEILTCAQGIRVNLTTMDAYIPSVNGVIHPGRFAYQTEAGLEIKEYNSTQKLENGRDVGVTLMSNGQGDYRMLVMDEALVGSMFTRLFFMSGHGLKYFDAFTSEQGFTGGRIHVYKVDWEGESVNYPYASNEFVAEEVENVETTQFDEEEQGEENSESIQETNSTSQESENETTE